MGKTKTNKSLSKRIRITKNGKIMRRRMGVNHFKTRKNANGIRRKRSTLTLDMSAKRMAALNN
jgi:large subunit ribosomal protein L35